MKGRSSGHKMIGNCNSLASLIASSKKQPIYLYFVASAAAFASYKFLIRFIISSFVSLYAYPVVIYKTFGRIHAFISGISIQSTKRTILSIPPSPAANVHPFDCASSNTSFTFIDTFYSTLFYLYYR